MHVDIATVQEAGALIVGAKTLVVGNAIQAQELAPAP